MNLRFRSKVFSFTGLGIVLLLLLVGTIRAFSRGANDFSVFYEAWRLVLMGRGSEIYRVSPDRFLYSPGFAWLLSPLGLLPRNFALALWCALKFGIVAYLIQKLSEPWKNRYKTTLIAMGTTAWGIILVSRPLLIDLEYGQVNLLILGACYWGLTGHFEKKPSLRLDFWRWFVLTFVAVAKLFPLPLLLVPFLVTREIATRKIKMERVAIGAGLLVSTILPALSLGWQRAYDLLFAWRDAVLAKGLPLESHNQSFTALLYHYMSGNPTHVISEGGQPLVLGYPYLSSEQIILLSLFWSLVTIGILVGWIVTASNHLVKNWIAVVIGLLIIPSHLVWKAYFVLSIPLAVLMIHQSVQRSGVFSALLLISLFVGINLTSFDFIGHNWAAHFEAASLMLAAHIGMIVLAARNSRVQSY